MTDSDYLRQIAGDASRYAGVDPERLRGIADKLDRIREWRRRLEYTKRGYMATVCAVQDLDQILM